jgi:hypothetical protein
MLAVRQGRGGAIDRPRLRSRSQIPMATQSFVNEMITSEGLAMNTPRYRYSRIFAVGYECADRARTALPLCPTPRQTME